VVALGRLRLGLSEWLLDQAIAHLRGRTTGGAPLIRQQLVRGHLADVAIIQQEVLGLLAAEAPGAYPHDRLTEADRVTLRLLGASGFLSDGPGRLAYLSELLADAYLEPS
jgi:alkylation response protein AidB-like acyl-CoA dehydrogenase